MSTNSECHFIEREPGKWFYVLEHSDAPKNSWDWMEYASAYGPFPTEEAAEDHLSKYHANPGSSWTRPYEEGREESEVLKKLLDEAPKRTKDMESTTVFFGRSNAAFFRYF